MIRHFIRWSPTIIYLALAICVCVLHQSNMARVTQTMGTANEFFVTTGVSLKQGVQLLPVVQAELARLGAHHTHHAADFVHWTTRAFWWLTLPGVAAAVIQGLVCLRWGSPRPSSLSATSGHGASSAST